MAAELVGGALVSAMFYKLFERLASPEFRRKLTGYKLKQLESELNNARIFLNDAENRQLRDKKIKEWLDDLKHVVFQADDLSEEIHDNNNNRKSRIKSLKSIYHSLVARGEIGEILRELVVLLDRAKELCLNRWDGTSRETRSSSSTIMEEHHVFGRADDKEKVLELLLSLSDSSFGGHRIRVVPIVGMGGIGKTTLAQLVYNDIRVKESEFELRAWVHMSSEFDVVKIIKTVLQGINPGVLESEIEELSALQRRMKDTLRGKKFLLVLDDVWNEDYRDWDLLMSVFSFGAPGSAIVVTTRSSKVGSMVSTGHTHELSGMPDYDCWSMFVAQAFIGGDSNIDPRLEEIGKIIVRKCDGLPLAVKTIAGLLRWRTAIEDWENVLKHVWEWDRHPSDEVLPSLWLSYQYLPSSLKQCFAYCSVFPADYKFHKEEMVLLWMAEGFLHTDGSENQSMEEIGEQYFEVLVSRSFFQRYGGDESMFLMHDLIHKLAVVVSGEFCVGFDSEYVNFDRVTERTRHLSHTNNVSFDSTMLWTSVSKAKHLRSFLSLSKYGDFSSEFVGKLITNQRRLRVLSLYTKDSISVSFRNLKHLRYLNLSRSTIVEVPSSVCDLVNLQTLLLSECSSLTQLPGETRKLKKLRHLDITGANLTNMPPQMGDLKELRTLTNFVLDDSDGFACSKIKEIGEFHHLREICISKLQNVDISEVVGNDLLRHTGNLKELALEWDDSGETGTRRDAEELLNALRPHANLEKLVIWNYPDSSFPAWVAELPALVSVVLRGFFCQSLPPLWQLRHLLRLVIQGFEVVETIGLEFYSRSSSITLFECLETLEFRGMKRLKEWVFIDKAFPCLKNLSLIECPELIPFPEAGLPKSLNHLHIKSCAKLMARRSCFDQQNVPSLVSLSIESCYCDSSSSSSSELFVQVLLPKSLASLKLVNLGGFKSINGSAFGQAQSLVHIAIRECHELESLPEKELPSSLSTLKIYNCRLLEIKYRKGDGEGYRHISHIPNLSIFGDTTVEMD